MKLDTYGEYVRRVVDTLTAFEDELIATSGFFGREEHLESCIQGVQSEFESNARAIAVFAAPEALSALVGTLLSAEDPRPADAPKEGRRFEDAFAAAVLLSSSIGTRGVLRNPTVLSRMWQFVERPERHPVLLYYWCRCAAALLLSPEGSGGLGAAISALGLPRLLLSLVPHLHCEAVRVLLKNIIGLGGQAGLGEEGAVPLQLALVGEQSILPSLMRLMEGGGDASLDAAELLCCVLEAVSMRADGARLLALVARPFLPLFTRAVAAGDCAAHRRRQSQIALLSLGAAALAAEQACGDADAGPGGEGPGGEGAPQAAPRVAEAVAALLGPLSRLLAHGSCEVARAAARLWSSFLDSAPQELLGCRGSCSAALVTTELFTRVDRNGGGRQDMLRHALLKALVSALRCDDARLGAAILKSAKLLPRLERNLLMREGAGGKASRCSPEHARLLVLEIAAIGRTAALAPHLARSAEWRRIGTIVGVELGGGAAVGGRACEPREASPSSSGGEEDYASAPEAEAEAEAGEMGGDEPTGAENVPPNRSPEGVGPTSPVSPKLAAAAPPPAREGEEEDFVIDNNSLRSSDDFSKLTPRPSFERRSVLHRKAKESSPYYRKDGDGRSAPDAPAQEDAAISALNETVKALSF